MSACAVDEGSATADGTAEPMNVVSSRDGTTDDVATAREGVTPLDWVGGRTSNGAPSDGRGDP